MFHPQLGHVLLIMAPLLFGGESSTSEVNAHKTSGAVVATDRIQTRSLVFRPGDLDFDGHIGTNDVAVFARFLTAPVAYLETIPGITKTELLRLADLDHDGRILESDLLLLKQRVAEQAQRQANAMSKQRDIAKKLDGLFLCLAYKGGPPVPDSQRMEVVYNSVKLSEDDQLRRIAKLAASQDIPVVINRELDDRMMNPARESWDTVVEEARYQLDRLGLVQAQGPIASLWDRPHQRSFGHAWKEGNDAAPRYEQLLRLMSGKAKPYTGARRVDIVGPQDFMSIGLYWPGEHKEFRDEQWPLTQLCKRGDYFVEKYRAMGKVSTVWLSPTFGGRPRKESDDQVPVEWLDGAVKYFRNQGVGVVIWGGFRSKWDPDNPMCQLLESYIDRNHDTHR